ncbi:MAG: UDP-glucose 4-epimerase GalE [Ruminococcaceae bacterium]|nr:UDP-glucose 4-epimerase GalE [Oscillospiraceae bacterium]
MKILVTGGTGYIGSHTVVELSHAGYDVLIADNYSNSKPEALNRTRQLCPGSVEFEYCDLRDKYATDSLFKKGDIDAVIHFAGLKAVGESVTIPLKYYENNLFSSINLLNSMAKFGVGKMVFSSSATVYGNPHALPIVEDFPVQTTNPYGATKLIIENIMKDVQAADKSFSFSLLRYFNPIGAHPSGLIGEDPNGIPNNLFPYVAKVAGGKLPHVNVYGNDYSTEDGTGVRDYIHVVDLAKGHLFALDQLFEESGIFTYNLGTGRGYSVLEVISAFEKACGHEIPYKIAPRRGGDIDACYADTSLAFEKLGWKAELDIEDMCRDGWNFQVLNPNGYPDA